jgi:hypothetical protein
MSGNLPDFVGSAVGGFVGIYQSPGVVSIFYDTGQGQGWHRVIPVDGSAHLPPSVRLWWGDSRGHWEGNTLVVDVTNFSAKSDYQGSRENLHLIERWTRLDANTLEYALTVEDPTTWTKPWTVELPMSNAGGQMYEYACHEGNYGMFGIMTGARAMDKASEEAAKKGSR